MQFQEYLGQKMRKFLPAEPFFRMSHMKCLSKCSYSKKSVLPRKTPGCAPVGFILTFHPNFHTNLWVFANLPIYKKLNHDNISHVFYMRYKIVGTQKYLHQKLDVYILFLIINIGIIIFVSVILKKIKIIFIHNYLHCCKVSKGYISNSSNISDYVNIVNTNQHYTRFTQNRFPQQKMLGNDRMETANTEATSIRRRNDI